ncbi:MAG: tetratricopeptide repeat protein [Candidatus Puniceispirillaceae bacterium]
MPRFPVLARLNALAAMTTPALDMRGWMATLLMMTALLAIGPRMAAADIAADQPDHISASAPVETGIAAAEAGCLRDAITILTPHADLGHATANYVLGLIYLHGNGEMAARPALSHTYFARAAAAGHVASIFETAFQLERGIGTDQDMDKAIHLYKIAARANHLNAQFNLAVLLLRHKADREGLQEAYFWAVAARHNAARTAKGALTEHRTASLARVIRSQITHQAATRAASAAARLAGQPV